MTKSQLAKKIEQRLSREGDVLLKAAEWQMIIDALRRAEA